METNSAGEVGDEGNELDDDDVCDVLEIDLDNPLDDDEAVEEEVILVVIG